MVTATMPSPNHPITTSTPECCVKSLTLTLPLLNPLTPPHTHPLTPSHSPSHTLSLPPTACVLSSPPIKIAQVPLAITITITITIAIAIVPPSSAIEEER